MFQFQDTQILFDSRKQALQYIKETYNIVFARKIEQEMLYHKTPYTAYHQANRHLDGMMLYYV
jgi:hypothetical protein